MKMNITDRECHHIVMGPQRYRCIQYSNERAVVLLCDTAIAWEKNKAPKLTRQERGEFRKHVSAYMDDVLSKSLDTGKRVVFSDVGEAEQGADIKYIETERLPNGDLVHHHHTAPSVDKLMEGL